MAKFIPGTPVETTVPTVEVTVGPDATVLGVGQHVFHLVVVDDAGNPSKPAEVTVVVKDTQAPTAVIAAPKQVNPGQTFVLDGSKSSDLPAGSGLPAGKITKWIWSLEP